jgi:hypothetical protein
MVWAKVVTTTVDDTTALLAVTPACGLHWCYMAKLVPLIVGSE